MKGDHLREYLDELEKSGFISRDFTFEPPPDQ